MSGKDWTYYDCAVQRLLSFLPCSRGDQGLQISKRVENLTLNDIETLPETVHEYVITSHSLRNPEHDFLLTQTYPGL